MSSRDPLQCTFEDASRETLLAGIALDTEAKVNFFEEMVSLAHAFGAYDRLAPRNDQAIGDTQESGNGTSAVPTVAESGS